MAAMKALLLPLLTPLLLAGAAAHAQTVQADGSEIRFVTRQMGVPVEGRFTRWQAQLAFDPRQPQAATVAFGIDTRSIAFGAAETEAEAATPAWFHSAQFPQAQFRSTAVKALGNGRYEVAGTLTIKGQAREVLVPVTLTPGPAAGQGTASGSFTLKRLDFRLGEGEWADVSAVANEVQVRFRLQLSGLAAP
jgi:polyisoprenoid-binding protein YceI